MYTDYKVIVVELVPGCAEHAVHSVRLAAASTLWPAFEMIGFRLLSYSNSQSTDPSFLIHLDLFHMERRERFGTSFSLRLQTYTLCLSTFDSRTTASCSLVRVKVVYSAIVSTATSQQYRVETAPSVHQALYNESFFSCFFPPTYLIATNKSQLIQNHKKIIRPAHLSIRMAPAFST